MTPTAENEVIRATACLKSGFGEFIEQKGDLKGLMAEADKKFPSTQMVAIQGEDTIAKVGEEKVRTRHPRYQGVLRGRVIAFRYPKGDNKSIWRAE